MAKKRRIRNKQQEKRGTNWLVIGGIIGIGIIALIALLYLAVREPAAQQSQSLSEYCDENSENCVTLGATDAPVTLVEVSDFGCPHCRAFHQEKGEILKEQYVDSDQVKWIFMPYALRPETVPAANAAFCANEHGKYYEFTEALFAQSPETNLTRTGFLIAAGEVGIDENPFTECLEDNRYNNVISDNQRAARAARVTGTPTFFVNDRIVRGNVPLEQFETLFAQATGS
ncbi:MAG: thioredoxin domain-containing protein [Candidatus Promineifilaceae bacterium]|nr:thioredoxin domain-containing protein [Candidatus Promineifilaceae bacterium]